MALCCPFSVSIHEKLLFPLFLSRTMYEPKAWPCSTCGGKALGGKAKGVYGGGMRPSCEGSGEGGGGDARRKRVSERVSEGHRFDDDSPSCSESWATWKSC